MFPKILIFVFSTITLNYIVDGKSLPKSLLRIRRDIGDIIAEQNPTKVTVEAWEEDKAAVLFKFLESAVSPNRNITIVAWQRVLDDEGKITNLNTIQVVIPPKPTENLETISYDEEPPEEIFLPHSKVDRLKKIVTQAEELGLPASASLEEFSADGKLETLIYTNKDELFVKQKDRIVIYNKTASITQQEVADFIDNLKPTILGEPTVLRCDADGNLLVDQSKSQPHILSKVDDQYEAPEDILQAGPKIMTKVSQQKSKDQIPEQLAIEFNLAFPEYTWRVLVDPIYYHIRKDVALTLTYDNSSSQTTYLVYGIKNE